ncbi:MAG: hypothetical protein AAGJ70_11325 [Pseudomonadota bacterium]
MLRLLSLALIIAAPAAALASVGYAAFSTPAVETPSTLAAIFVGLPAETGWAGPVVALALVAGAYIILRIVGFAISVIIAGGTLAMMFVVYVKPEWLELIRTALTRGNSG